jgi:hypothetical protein
VSEYTVNTGLYAAHKTGLIDYTVTSGQVPASSPVQLNTSWLGILIPNLSKKYGMGKACNIRLHTVEDWPQILFIDADD